MVGRVRPVCGPRTRGAVRSACSIVHPYRNHWGAVEAQSLVCVIPSGFDVRLRTANVLHETSIGGNSANELI